MLNAVVYLALKIYFSLFFVIYLLTRLGGGDPGIWWDVTGILSLLFFLSNLIWMVAKG
jgi:hypothetical protein